MRKTFSFFVVLTMLFGAVSSFAQDVQNPDSTVVSETSTEQVSQPVSEPATESVAPVVESGTSTSETSLATVAADTAKPAALDAVKSAKKGGLLASLFPVEKDEAIAKGHIYSGLSLSLIQANSEDDALNIMIGDVYEAYGYTFTLEAFGGYFIKDAMAVGLRAGYSRTWYDIDFALLEDLLDMKQHRKYVSNGFFIQPMLKNYFKVFDSRNLYFFNETSISVGYSYGISQSDNGEEMDKSRNTSWSIDVGINPGICIMVLDRFAFETSVGLLGLSTSVMDIEENGETSSRVVANIVNFTINLLALNFSLVAFF
ncbi:MAG: hypothetical protein MJZ05_03760 [Fibrobacter sp.]|nr:hypothetical protein [Fibrobacter sp.]